MRNHPSHRRRPGRWPPRIRVQGSHLLGPPLPGTASTHPNGRPGRVSRGDPGHALVKDRFEGKEEVFEMNNGSYPVTHVKKGA
jgi:hypothetical protein